MTKQRNSWNRALRHPAAAAVSAALVAGLAIGQARAADDYPSRPVHIVVPFTPGGPNDFMARPVAQALSTIFGKTFLVENKPGADGIIGTAAVASSAPDGYTMLITTGSFLANAVMRKDLPYSPMKDFLPVTQLAESYGLVLVSRPEFPAKNLEELIALTKKNPGKYSYATSGVGNVTHIAGELFKKAAGLDMVAVAYKGSGGSMVDVLSGHVEFAFLSTTIAVPQIKAGRLRAYASTGGERVPTISDVPTMTEKGFPDVYATGYYGVWFPAGVPDDIVEKVRKAIVEAIKAPEVAAFMKKTDLKPIGSTPAEFGTYLAKDLEWQKKAIALIGLEKKL
jgi:tripartite-type tricarboxylate transporter receptor subunit TctC